MADETQQPFNHFGTTAFKNAQELATFHEMDTYASGVGSADLGPFPQWTNLNFAKGLVNSSGYQDTLRKTKSGLKGAEKILQTAESTLSSIQQLIKLLKLFELSFQNLLFGFITAILDQFQLILNDFKYSGVYLLDLVSYHFINEPQRIAHLDISYREAIKQGPYFSVNDDVENEM